MFISSTHIYHVEASFDSIFPATTKKSFGDLRDPYYYNSDPRARPMACVDTTDLCFGDGEICWSMTSPLPPNVPDSGAYWLMKWALEKSNTYESIKYRLGSALLAAKNVAQYVSTPLSPEQWVVEGSALFATSLARIQYEANAIATGEDRERPGYIEVTPDEGRGRLCRIYKFKSTGYSNINILAWVGLSLLAAAIWLLSWKASRTESHSEDSDQNLDGEPLLVDVVIVWVWESIIWVSKRSWNLFSTFLKYMNYGIVWCLQKLGK
jgi:hypothetical protein